MLSKDKVVEVAKQCFDPEIPVNIWDLGLIYEINISEDEQINIRMSLTTQACPAAQQIPDDLKSKITKELGTDKVTIDVVFDPPWTPERITEEGKKKLGIETE